MHKAVWATLLLLGCSGPSEQEPMGEGGAQAGGTQAGGAPTGGTQTGGAPTGGTQAGGTQAGGAQAGGGASATGGNAGAGGQGNNDGGKAGQGGSATCAERWSTYEPLANAARVCDPNAGTPQCSFNIVVLDACGCTVPANGSSPEYAEARRLVADYAEDCEFPQQCVNCPATLNATCAATGTGTSQCVYE